MRIAKVIRRVVQSKHPIAVSLMAAAATIIATSPVHAETAPQANFPLWEKATAYMSRNQWISGKMTEHERTYDLKKKLIEESHSVMEFSPQKNGGIRLHLVSVEENGKDVTRQARHGINTELSLDDIFGDSPFVPEKEKQVTIRMNGQHQNIKGRPCTAFKFVMSTKNEAVEGTAWLDRKTGRPVEVHSTLTSVPFAKEDVTITAYQSSEYFTITPEGHCLRIRSREEMELEIPQWGFKGRVITDSVGTDHWKYEPAH